MDRSEKIGIGSDSERFKSVESVEEQSVAKLEKQQESINKPQAETQEHSAEVPTIPKQEQQAVETETPLKKGIQEVVRSEMSEAFLATSSDVRQQIKATSGELLREVEVVLSGMDESNQNRQSDLLLERVYKFVKTLGAQEPYTISAARNLTEALLDLRVVPSD